MPEREPVPGDVLGERYRIVGELGRGGMATVYRGLDLRLQRRVAVKVFRNGFAEAVDPDRTLQEMQLLAGVNHPSVVSVLDASTGDGVFGAHLVMELVAGADLGLLLHRARGPLSADFARRIVADVAGALEALHAQGVVHRDVKPANILVPDTAASPTASLAAKLTDFGIAQLVDGARMTGPEAILGTAAYLSPEQVRGSPAHPASDVYSLGLVLLEALTGQRAFPGPAAESALARLQRPPALPADASPALADLLSRMTALDPDHRPSAGEVRTLLTTRLAGLVTAPDLTLTAATPIAGLPVVRAAQGPDATAPQVHVWTPGAGVHLPVAARTAAVPVRRRRRFPAVLAVAASVLACAIAGVAISAATGITGAPEPARADAHDAAATTPADEAAAVTAPGLVRRIAPKPRASASPSPSATPDGTPTPAASSAAPTPGATEPVAPPVAPSPSATPDAPTPSPSATPVSPSPTPSASTPSDTPTATPSASAAPADGVVAVPTAPADPPLD